jgi:hypothetical protein
VAHDRTLALVDVIAAALSANDPLDPWNVVSNYDDTYWNGAARDAEPAIAGARSETEVLDALRTALGSGSTKGLVDPDAPYPRDRIASAARSVWTWLQQ